MKLTEWFPENIKPVNKGVYQVKALSGQIRYSKWSGKNWMFMQETVEKASSYRMGRRSMHQAKEWRGIAK